TGSLVAMDPNTGEILAMVSAPFFQTDRLSGRLDREYWVEINNDPQRPLFNRAVTTRQPPGSTFKPVMGLLGLRLGIITPETRVQCTGGYFLGRLYRCTERHGSQNLEQAIMNSCNTYFYALMNRLVNQYGLNVWHEMVAEFGLGRRNGLD